MSDINSKRTKCLIYTRVMGYFQEINNFNLGKKSEFYSRTYYDVNKNIKKSNKNFNDKFKTV